MTSVAFDFRKPPPGELERQMGKWLTLTTRQATGVWARLIPYPTELKPGSVVGVSAAHGMGQLTDDTVGLPFTTTDSGDGTLLLAIQRPVLLGLLAGLLGETPTLLPNDRDLTDLEASLIDYLMRELFLNPLEKGWPGADLPAFTAGNLGSPRSAWRMPGGDAILLATILISTPFGEHPAFTRAQGRAVGADGEHRSSVEASSSGSTGTPRSSGPGNVGRSGGGSWHG